MITIGAFEAKTHLSGLLEKVRRGEEVLITKRGKPVARLVPPESAEKLTIREAIDGLRNLRKRLSLGGEDWKDLRDAGRR